MPDWLAGLQAVAPTESAAEVSPAAPSEEPSEETVAPLIPTEAAAPKPIPREELPEWVQSLDRAQQQPSGPAAPIPPELPPELREEEPTEVELPAWLQSLRAEQESTLVQPVRPEEPVLTQAEIPAWLEALRPVEGKQPEEAAEVEATAEEEGIFAGIAQVLPAATLMGEVQSAPAKLRVEVSPEDLARAGIFQELLARSPSAPTAVVAPSGKAARVTRHLSRLLIFAFVFILVAAPFFISGLSFLPQVSDLPTAPVKSAYDRIQQLSGDATALVVFDYDPIQAGELNPVAEALLRHLQARGVRVEIASLNPLGPSVAQSVVKNIEAEFGVAVEYEDLGYVPGQAVGVQNLLSEVAKVDLVVNLAASPDSLRWWVEQIAIGDIKPPLIAGLSAAAETLAAPYVQSGQIDGVVTGLVGAMMYARQADLLHDESRPQQGVREIFLKAQMLGQLARGVIILVGIISAFVVGAGRRVSA